MASRQGKPRGPQKSRATQWSMLIAGLLLQAGKYHAPQVDETGKVKRDPISGKVLKKNEPEPAKPGFPAFLSSMNKLVAARCKATGKPFDKYQITLANVGGIINTLHQWYRTNFVRADAVVLPNVQRDYFGNIEKRHVVVDGTGVDAKGKAIKVLNPEFDGLVTEAEFDYDLQGLPEVTGRTASTGPITGEEYVEFDYDAADSFGDDES